jgi:hypothetical protein
VLVWFGLEWLWFRLGLNGLVWVELGWCSWFGVVDLLRFGFVWFVLV